MNQRAKTEVICLGVLLAIYVSLGIKNLPLLKIYDIVSHHFICDFIARPSNY